jgi:hypothetical protein
MSLRIKLHRQSCFITLMVHPLSPAGISAPGESNFLGYYKRRSIIATQESIGFFAQFPREFFGLAVHVQPWAQEPRGFAEADFIQQQVLLEPFKGIHEDSIVLEGLEDGFSVGDLAKTEGNISHVGQGAGEVPRFDVGI